MAATKKTTTKPSARGASAQAKPGAGATATNPAARKPSRPDITADLDMAGDLGQDAFIETANEQLEGVTELMRQFAHSGLDTSRSAYDSLRDAADAATASFEETSEATRAAGEKVVAAYFDALSANAHAALETTQALSGAGSFDNLFEIWTSQGRNQFDVMQKKNEALYAAVMHYVDVAAKPVQASFARGFAV